MMNLKAIADFLSDRQDRKPDRRNDFLSEKFNNSTGLIDMGAIPGYFRVLLTLMRKKRN